MSAPTRPGLSRGQRERVQERLAPRPWPPPEPGDAARAVAATVLRLLDDHGGEASARGAGAPPRGGETEPWLALVESRLAPEVKSLVVDGRAIVAGAQEWKSLPTELRRAVEAACPVLRTGNAGADASEWGHLLPPDALPDARRAEVARGPLLAFRSELRLPWLGTVTCLHVWLVVHGEAQLQEDLSGVVAIEPLPAPPPGNAVARPEPSGRKRARS